VDKSKLLGSTLIPAAISTVVFLVGLRIAIGARLLEPPYLELLGSLFGAGTRASLYLGLVTQALIGLAWGVVYAAIFENPTRLNALIFSVWQTMLTVAFMEIALLPPVGSSLTTLAFPDAIKLAGALWILHLVYMMTFLSVKAQPA
jgi:hypothetical protein